MKRLLVLFALVVVASAIAGAPRDAKKRTVACRTTENAKTCYWTHGRLSVYNGGSPNFRLWKIGTHRLLGIYSSPQAEPFNDGLPDEAGEDVELPANLSEQDFTKASVFGDFEVCPLAPEKEERMQPACIESARNIVTFSSIQAKSTVNETPASLELEQRAAEKRWLGCKRLAWSKVVEQMKLKGNPMPGRPNLFTEKTPGAFDEADKQLTLDDAICYRAYQQELVKILAASDR
jgi:hypothetical protein